MIPIRRPMRVMMLPGLASQRLRGWRGALGGLAAAAVSVSLSLLLRLVLEPWIEGAQFITFFPAVILATLLFGTISGVAAVGFSVMAAVVVVRPNEITPEEQTSLLLFVLVGSMDVAIISALLAVNAALKASLAEVGQLNQRLRISEARFREVVETAPDAIVIADRESRIVLVNAEVERLLGYGRDELLGRPIDVLMPARFRGAHLMRIAHFTQQQGTRRMGDGQEMCARRKDGSEIPIETNISQLPGSTEGLVCAVIRDLSSRREQQERQQLLIGELNHRVKNTLASVQSIVSQTLRAASNPRAFTEALTSRIIALSQSHDVLTRNDWSGAEVRDIVAEQLRPYERPGGPTFPLTGPEIWLTPNRAVTLGMAIGELATNAGKFGARSVGEGVVSVSWERLGHPQSRPWVKLVWRESGGPPVTRPHELGFGSRLIERSLAIGLHGSARLDFAPTGLVCELEFPLQDDELRPAA